MMTGGNPLGHLQKVGDLMGSTPAGSTVFFTPWSTVDYHWQNKSTVVLYSNCVVDH